MAEYSLYFIPLSSLTETQGTFVGSPTGTIFPSSEVPNIFADNDYAGFSRAQLTLTGPTTRIDVIDDDGSMNDEEPTPATLAAPVPGLPESQAGDVVEALYAYQLTAPDGTVINVSVLDIESDGSYSPDGIVADAPLQPGVTYTITEVHDWLGAEVNQPYETLVPCFTPDALIDTETGPLAADLLRIGDRVRTQDNGLQAIRWIGRRTLSAAFLRAHPNLVPVRISAGALGAGLPFTDLIVSPQHRVLVRSRIAQRMFDAPEVLIAAKQLTALEGICLCTDDAPVTYLHFLLSRHEVIFANGAATESLYTGRQALKSVPPEAAAEILNLFPQLRAQDAPPPKAARPLIPGRKARQLAARHLRNALPLFAA